MRCLIVSSRRLRSHHEPAKLCLVCKLAVRRHHLSVVFPLLGTVAAAVKAGVGSEAENKQMLLAPCLPGRTAAPYVVPNIVFLLSRAILWLLCDDVTHQTLEWHDIRTVCTICRARCRWTTLSVVPSPQRVTPKLTACNQHMKYRLSSYCFQSVV